MWRKKREWLIPSDPWENLRNFWMMAASMALVLAGICMWEKTGNLLWLGLMVFAKMSNDYRMKNDVLDWKEEGSKLFTNFRNDPRWRNLK